MKGNWFTIHEMAKKMKYNELVCKDVIDLLSLTGFVYRKVNDKNIILHKVTIDDESKLILLNDELDAAKYEVERIERQIELLKK